MERDAALARAIKKVGGFTATAEALGITPPTVHEWRKCPLHWVRRISELSGVPKHELAPDLYDAPAPETAVSR